MQALNTYKPPPMPIDHLATFVNYEMSAQHNTRPTKRAASAILCERNAVFWEIGKERNSDKDRMAGIRPISVGHHALDCEVYGSTYLMHRLRNDDCVTEEDCSSPCGQYPVLLAYQTKKRVWRPCSLDIPACQYDWDGSTSSSSPMSARS